MASGWGEQSTKGDWYAVQNFDLRNLRIQAGGKLPPAWQVPQNVKYLQQQYGEDCVVRKTPGEIKAELSGEGAFVKVKGKKK